MTAYILESKDEGARLERQNTARLYRVEDELREVRFKDNSRILDVGCGTGALLRHILRTTNQTDVTGIDLSKERLHLANSFLDEELRTRTTLVQGNIVENTFPESSFDYVTSRFVMHHLDRPIEALWAMKRVLKNGGEMIVVDSDGILFNFYSDDNWLMDALEKLKKNMGVDMFAARKLKSMFHSLGFQNVKSHIMTMHFTGDELREEAKQYEERFVAIRPLLIEVLGELGAARFTDSYVKALRSDKAELFYNKFICTGKKL